HASSTSRSVRLWSTAVGRSPRALRRQRDELADALLVLAICIALRPNRLILRRRNAGDAEDRSEDDRLTGERDQAPRRERDPIHRIPEPHAPLEEVIRVPRVAPQAGVADLAGVRGLPPAKLIIGE